MKLSIFTYILLLAPMLMAGEAEVKAYKAKLAAVEALAERTADKVESEHNRIKGDGASCPFPREVFSAKGKATRLDIELNDQLDALLFLKNQLTDKELEGFKDTNDKITKHFMRISLAQNTMQAKCSDTKSAETLSGKSNPVAPRMLARDPVEADR